jgi:DNA-binding transcriptional ArsR family regulator
MATQTTLETLFGGKAAAKVLLYIENYGQGYAAGIAKTFEVSRSEIQKQLTKFEESGILVSQKVGNVRVYSFNPRDPALKELKSLLRITLEIGIPDKVLKKYYRERRRPRRQGKTLDQVRTEGGL